MAELDPSSIDVATLAWLAGSTANELLVDRLRANGHAGVRLSHGYVVQHLIEGAPTVSELAAALGVTQQAASKHVLELEQLGYVARRADPTDHRRRRITLTTRGQRLVADARRLREELETELVERIGPRSAASARKTLVALLDVVGATGDVARRRVRPVEG